MAQTNFAALTTEQKTAWSRTTWHAARNMSVLSKLQGTGQNSIIQKVTELTKDERGDRAVITLVPDLIGDGVTGDNQLEDNEESLRAFDQVIQIDYLRNANRTTGRMTDQKSIVNFRTESRSALAYWLADRCDQMGFLTMAGVPYTKTNKGALRPVNPAGQNLNDLLYAGDVTAPSANRHYVWDKANKVFVAGDETDVVAGNTIDYAAIVKMHALAIDLHLKGVKGGEGLNQGGEDLFHLFIPPSALAGLRLDPDFIAHSRDALGRGMKNPIWAGQQSVYLDGIWIHAHRHSYNVDDAAAGDMFGATGNIKGYRACLLGSQALAFADIGVGTWDEKSIFDYNNQKGIAIGKIMGFKKPVFRSIYSGTDEDFGVCCFDFPYA